METVRLNRNNHALCPAGQNLTFSYLTGQVLEAWEKAVSTMHVNEKSEIICGPEYAYGEEGYQPMVPGNATLCFHLEIVHAELPQDPVPQRIEEATTHKTRGNAHFKTGAYHLSQESYKAGLDRLRTTWGASVHDDMEIQKLRTALYSNLAEAYIRTLDASDAVRACEGGLAVAPQNTKMWYRLGRAKTMLKDWEGAQSALDTAEDVC
ncbi:uncharacterized protein EV422DRAFT_493640 [Fimicolochytrium jonesii]|uniref:uncharacterized protein n=1 Tax=Fimicolochytrium jonesii TaxID=1396493 RepID=UPI0022FE43C1|nr:uncharacterized protein EV422DRAFT_493640 [Fimicolochytrium jonesii]KAI8823399.1 hypothetical protein EV422DRAFT_493640 [Fimicolochytrium jonesii]